MSFSLVLHHSGQRYRSVSDHLCPWGRDLDDLVAQMCVSAYVFKQSGLWRTEAGNEAVMGMLFTVLWAIC